MPQFESRFNVCWEISLRQKFYSEECQIRPFVLPFRCGFLFVPCADFHFLHPFTIVEVPHDRNLLVLRRCSGEKARSPVCCCLKCVNNTRIHLTSIQSIYSYSTSEMWQCYFDLVPGSGIWKEFDLSCRFSVYNQGLGQGSVRSSHAAAPMWSCAFMAVVSCDHNLCLSEISRVDVTHVILTDHRHPCQLSSQH